MEILGTIKLIKETQSISDTFKKRELILETEGEYPQSLKIEFTQDKCDILDNYQTGNSVKISINLRGREWVNKEGETVYFNSIQGWRIEANETEQEQPQTDDKKDDGLPF